jgi:hypothetical protein
MRKTHSCGSYLTTEQSTFLDFAYKNEYDRPGYDWLCDEKRIDVKSSTTHYSTGSTLYRYWTFSMNLFYKPDFYLFVAIDSVDNPVPILCWLIPGDIRQEDGSTYRSCAISQRSFESFHKWSQYKINIDEITNELHGPHPVVYTGFCD